LAAKRCGREGAAIMKIIKTTSSTSMSGVTFMKGLVLMLFLDMASPPIHLPKRKEVTTGIAGVLFPARANS